jgi:hypothetical protein
MYDTCSHQFNSNNLWRRVEIMKLFIVKFSPISCYLFLKNNCKGNLTN